MFLHSGQTENNKQLDETLLNLFAGKEIKLGYIPSQSDRTREYFQHAVEWYNKLGITDIFYFDLDEEYEENRIEELFSCNAIFLSGGNTFTFLNLLQKRKFLPKLREYVERGGVLIGVSAGSIIMSQTIDIATIDSDIGGDENSVRLTDFRALELNDFDFFPHYDGNPEITERLKAYSKKSGKTIYACDDGSGIFVDEIYMHFFGNVWKINNGLIKLQL